MVDMRNFIYEVNKATLCFFIIVIVTGVNWYWFGVDRYIHLISCMFFIFSLFHRRSEKTIIYNNDIKRVDEDAKKDRQALLLLLARSYRQVDRLIIEKKHPESNSLVLVFQLKNGNLRFSFPENEFPDYLRPRTTKINTEKVNFKKNYRLIDELVEELNCE